MRRRKSETWEFFILIFLGYANRGTASIFMTDEPIFKNKFSQHSITMLHLIRDEIQGEHNILILFWDIWFELNIAGKCSGNRDFPSVSGFWGAGVNIFLLFSLICKKKMFNLPRNFSLIRFQPQFLNTSISKQGKFPLRNPPTKLSRFTN